MKEKHALQPWELIVVSCSIGLNLGRYGAWSDPQAGWDVEFLMALLLSVFLVMIYVFVRVALSVLISRLKGE